jgi:hypothetical protein
MIPIQYRLENGFPGAVTKKKEAWNHCYPDLSDFPSDHIGLQNCVLNDSHCILNGGRIAKTIHMYMSILHTTLVVHVVL